jgi:hypothetical protein
MRIGECADLASDCLRSTGPDLWAIHVPLGKLKTERLVPVDPFVCKFVQRLRFFRSLERLPNDEFLLPRPRTKEALIRQLRDYLHQVCHEFGLSARIVSHQFRHTYASEMLRAGVGLPALMNLLGHVDPDMTMRYLDVTLTDLQREFQLARSKPRYLPPQPKAPVASLRVDLNSVIDALFGAQHVLEMFRRTPPRASASTGSPTDSQKSSPRQRASAPVEPGQRLAAYARHSSTIHIHTSHIHTSARYNRSSICLEKCVPLSLWRV